MKLKPFVFAAGLATVQGWAMAADAAALPQLGRDSLAEVIAAMTTEEKASLVVGMGIRPPRVGVPALDPEDLKVPEKVLGSAGRTHPVARLGIPSITLADGPAGVNITPVRGDSSKTYYAVGFPIGTQLASTWNPQLVRQVGEAIGNEAREYGVDILLAPGMNIHRNPLGGRNFEYYSEDPLVSGKMAAAYVQGVQSQGVGTSIKHYAANSSEWNRMQSNSVIGERALREIYLKGFEIAVKESQPWTLMSSYNLLNGTYTSQSKDLLTTVLRQEQGFKGFVMSDWYAGNDPVAQIRAGNDLLMPGNPGQSRAIVEAVSNGRLDIDSLNRSVERMLSVILRSSTFKQYPYSSSPNLVEHAAVARAAAAEGIILLKNAGQALPLRPAMNIALFGNASYDLIAGGTGSGDVHKPYVVSIAQGLADAGYAIDPQRAQAYASHITEKKAARPKLQYSFFLPPPIAEFSLAAEELKEAAGKADVAVYTLGRNSGELQDRVYDNDYTVSEAELKLIKSIADSFHAQGKKLVVVMNVAAVTEVVSWRELADAIVLAWHPGQEGGSAIADVLSGRINPSGKLASTFPIAYKDVPSSRSFPGEELKDHPPLLYSTFAGKPALANYDEGLYVGYRYYNSFGVKPAYEFGYGLSYTRFGFSGLKLNAKRFTGRVVATTTVTNTGATAGKEVVQLYVGAPARLDNPAAELRAFAKTRLLQPGESETVTFELGASDLASYVPGKTAWVLASGEYVFKIGASSLDLKHSATLVVPKDVLVERVNKVLAPSSPLVELRLKR